MAQPPLSTEQARKIQETTSKEPHSTSGWGKQIEGNVKYATGVITGDEEKQHSGLADINLGKYEKHAARSISHAEASDFEAKESVREEGKALKKLGKVTENEEMKKEGDELKHMAEKQE